MWVRVGVYCFVYGNRACAASEAARHTHKTALLVVYLRVIRSDAILLRFGQQR